MSDGHADLRKHPERVARLLREAREIRAELLEMKAQLELEQRAIQKLDSFKGPNSARNSEKELFKIRRRAERDTGRVMNRTYEFHRTLNRDE
jgi:cell division septum initiation protein DivIVA